MPDVALLIDWENVYYTLRQHTDGPLPSSLSILQAILQKAAEFGPVRVKQAIFGSEVANQDETLLMALEFTGIEPVAVAQRMSGRLLKGRSDAILITRTMKLLYKDRPEIQVWFIVSGDRDLNALCKALKDEDKNVYLVAGDKSLANELRESPYLRDDVFLLEDLIPEARWIRTGQLRTDDTQADKQPLHLSNGAGGSLGGPRLARGRGTRGGRGRGGSGGGTARVAPVVPAVVPTGTPESEKEQRRLVVLLMDQLVALRADDMPRGDFVRSVVPLSEQEASTVLEQRIDAAVDQQHVRAVQAARTRLASKQLLAPNFSSPLVAETVFHLVRVLRRIDSVTSKDTRRIPAVEAVLDPLSRADQPGGLAKGRTQRRLLLETLFNIAEERGAIATEQVARDGRQITMCWLADEHPLVRYARQASASIVHLFSFVGSTKTGEKIDWVNSALFSELLSRVEGDALESNLRRAVESGVMRGEDHGRKAGYVIDRANTQVVTILGKFSALAVDGEDTGGRPGRPAAAETEVDAVLQAGSVERDDGEDDGPDTEDGIAIPGSADASIAVAPPKRRTRGRRGGRGRRKPGVPEVTPGQ
ncbi:MAG TPA: NYN domain-containing protein [Candidatus Saccharimonadales bacterium]|nr:NYN domain-containing protein [Candidatus Saccharimonadales bacterium]